MESEKRKLKALSDIASIDITLEFNDILKEILKITCEAIDAYSGTIMLVDEVTEELRMVASHGLGQDYPERVHETARKAGVPLTYSPSGTVLRTGKYYIVPNVFEEPRDKPWLDLTKELGFSSIIFTPMKKGSQTIGLLNVYMAEPHNFTDEEIDFISIAASRAASVVQNVRICSRLEDNVRELQGFRERLEERIEEAHKRLYDSEKYLRTVIESSLDGIAVMDEQDRFEFGNDSFFRTIGWEKEEIIGAPFEKIVPEDARESVKKCWMNIKDGNERYNEAKIRTRSGEIKYLQISHSQTGIRDEKKVVCIVKDVTRNKELEQALRESEAKYRDFFENAADAMYVNDADGYIRNINRAGLKALGCSAEDVIGTHVSRWFTPESMRLIQETVKKRILGEPTEYPMIQQVVTKSGELRWAEIRSRIIRDGDRVVGFQGMARDITEKMELEQKLKEAGEKYRDLFENANDSLYIFDGDGYFREVNNTTLKLLGCTKEEMIGTHISKWITPESLRIAQESLEKQTAGESIEEPVMLEVICKNGEHRWIEVKRRIIRDGFRVKEVHGIARDITEKKRLEQELIESEAKYRDLFENADEPMFTLNPEGYFLGLNNAGLKILGSTRDELIGSHLSGWLTPESYEIAQVAIKKRLRGEPVEPPSVLELINKSGEHIWVEVKSRVLRDGDSITGIHGIARDITEKKRLEQELIESEARYRDLFEKAEDPMYTLDTAGCFQAINNAGLKSLGCTKEEVIGTHMSKWLTPESLRLSQEVLGKQISGISIEYPINIEIIRKSGEHRWGEIRTRVIRDGDRITGIHGIARDITEKMRLEQQLKEYHEKLKRSYEELIESDRLRNEFVSNITHELLTPLTSIRGFTELLHDGTTGKISSEQKKSLEIILRNSDRLIRLIKDLLDVAHLEKNRFGLQFSMVSVGDILIKSAQDVQPQARYKEITIVQDIEPLPRIWGDEGRLIQVITNLLTNAIKFTPQGGKITITAKENKSEIKISIADTGIGIPHDKLSRVFERFYQIDGSASRKFGGTGLGLSICKIIVESHYGTIWAESCDSGSTFHVVLPKLENGKKTGS